MSERRGQRPGAPEPGAIMTRPREAAREEAEDDGISSILRRSLKEAIARWAVRSRAPRPSWLRPQDEALHPWDGRRHYAEDYTFVGVLRELAVVVRLEWLPGRESHRLWVIVFEDDGVYALPGSGQQIVRGAGGGLWRVGGLTIDCDEPFARWTIGYRGKLDRRGADGRPRIEDGADAPALVREECRIDLTFLAEEQPFVPGTDDDADLLSRHLGDASWDARLLRGLRRRQSRSYVQVGELAGTIAIGERLLAIDAAALRMHSWGVRDWGGSDRALHCFIAEGKRPRLWVHRARFPWLTLEGGFVVGPQGLEPVRDLGVTVERRPAGAPRRVGLDLETSDAHGVAVEGEAISELSLDMDGRGRLELAFIRVGKEGAGIWVGQRRTLPRPDDRSSG